MVFHAGLSYPDGIAGIVDRKLAGAVPQTDESDR